jgi:hypothetical protein
MFSVPRFLGGLAAAGLSAVALTSPAHAAGTVGYTDNMCTAFYADPSSPPPNQVMKCARMACSVMPDGSYARPVGNTITLLVTCQNPPAATYKWVLSPRSDPNCPRPAVDTANNIQVVSATPITCYYEVVAGDGNSQTGWVRYGVIWQ